MGTSHALLARVPAVCIAILWACVLVHGFTHYANHRAEQAFENATAQSNRALADGLATMGKPIKGGKLNAEQQRLVAQLEAAPPSAEDSIIELQLRDAKATIAAIPQQLISHRFGYNPAQGGFWRALTSAFVHGSWWHLLGNLLLLYVVAPNLEDRWGRPVFAGFYLLGAFVSAWFFGHFVEKADVFLVGASGAIAACMGAFLVAFMRADVKIMYFFTLLVRTWIGTKSVPAWVFLPFWFGGELTLAMLNRGELTGVAFSAHVGGFLFGMLFALSMKVSGLDERLAEGALV
jgi:membrane associated rhomboid family serine protease